MSELANKIIVGMIILIMILFACYMFIIKVNLSVPVSSEELTVNYTGNEEIQIYIGKEKCVITNLIVSEDEDSILIELKGRYNPNSGGTFGTAKDKISIAGKDKIVCKSIFGKKEIYSLKHEV